METIQSSLYAIASGLCVFFYLISRQRLTSSSIRYFYFYLLLTGISFVLEWFLHHPEIKFKPLWLALMMNLSFFIAPCLWLYALESINKQPPPLTRINVYERLIILFGCLFLLPLLTVSFFQNREQLLFAPLFDWIHELMLLSILLYLIQVAIYLRRCVAILRQETRNQLALFSNLRETPLAVLRCLIWVVAGSWLCDLSRTLLVMFTDGPSLLYLLITICETGLIIWAMYQITDTALATGNPVVSVDASPKYATYSMDENALLRVEQRIRAAMIDQKLYQNSSLNLSSLSSSIGESTHYVSQVINQRISMSFYELVNRYRIEAAKQLLESRPQDSILSIALEVGYNSKSTFNAAFKRLETITPSQFRAQRTTGPKPVSNT